MPKIITKTQWQVAHNAAIATEQIAKLGKALDHLKKTHPDLEEDDPPLQSP